ncbi:MAG TPA: hypothetical protein VMZ53_20630 [Kofleriaceae bacterium]|nr:hypothetical protein [Kofleriaceae bacterium]
MRRAALLLVLAACGDNLAGTGSFELVGHTDLGGRGMNSAIAIAGDTAYVGSRIDGKPILIVDIADPANPTVVGEIGTPLEGLPGMSSRELRVVGNTLVVMNLQCSPSLHGCATSAGEVENLRFFDITDPRAPVVRASYPVQGTSQMFPRSPHEMFLWRDPADASRSLIYLAAPGVPSLEVIDVATATNVLRWDPYAQGGVPKGGANNILHSIAISDDGKSAYLSHQVAGLFVVDLTSFPTLTTLTPAANAPKFGAMGPHSAVPVPGRSLLVTTEEVYPPPFGAGCPWGHLRMVDIADPTRPMLLGEYKLAENDPACAADGPMIAFTSHNATVTHDLAIVTWYAGGLQAVDISDPANPTQLAEFRPEPLAAVAVEDPGLGGSHVEMWSYPIIKDGLIYVVDVRNGLYVMRYRGRWADQIRTTPFAEGNSNL